MLRLHSWLDCLSMGFLLFIPEGVTAGVAAEFAGWAATASGEGSGAFGTIATGGTRLVSGVCWLVSGGWCLGVDEGAEAGVHGLGSLRDSG